MTTLILDQSQWGQIALVGADRLRFLQGMCTSNIATLEPEQWLKTVMLNHKGRVLSIFDVVHFADRLLLICEPALADKTAELLDKHIIADDVEIVRDARPIHRVWSSHDDVWSAPPVFGRAEGSPAQDLECLRIEAGMPRYGVDVDEDNFPFETPLSRLIDYQKGCYVGQEPIARVHARGAPNKELMGVRGLGHEAWTEDSELRSAAGKVVGSLRSRCYSPELGPIALGYVTRVHIESGEVVYVGERSCTLSPLPF